MLKFFKNIIQKPFPLFSTFEVYFDFGTNNTRIAVKNKGIVLKEYTCLGLNSKTKEYVFFGNEAKSIIGKTPEFLKIIKPIINGIINNFDSEVALLNYFMDKSVNVYLKNYKIIKPSLQAVVAVPYIATEIEKKAVEEVINKLGFSYVYLIEKPLVNASGYKINVFSHNPVLVVDLGGGLIEAAIVSGGGIVNCKVSKNAGENMNNIIANYVYLKHGIILGESTCEQTKLNLLNFVNEEKIMTVRGKSLETGLPKSIRLKTSEIKEAMFTNFMQIIDLIKELIEVSPPEVVDEVYNNGIILGGGLANIPGIDTYFAKEIKIDMVIPKEPSNITIDGLINICKNSENLLKLSLPKI